MPWSNGASLVDGDKWTVDTPQMVEAYEYYQSFFQKGIANPAADRSSGAQRQTSSRARPRCSSTGRS